jgi:hypothetical protein
MFVFSFTITLNKKTNQSTDNVYAMLLRFHGGNGEMNGQRHVTNIFCEYCIRTFHQFLAI